jgi:hypothetical protein
MENVLDLLDLADIPMSELFALSDEDADALLKRLDRSDTSEHVTVSAFGSAL